MTRKNLANRIAREKELTRALRHAMALNRRAQETGIETSSAEIAAARESVIEMAINVFDRIIKDS